MVRHTRPITPSLRTSVRDMRDGALRPALALFARAPIAGQAKTRLIPRFGADAAARLQRLLIRRAVRTARDADVGSVSLWCTPNCRHTDFVAVRRDLGIRLREQKGNELGERMFNAFGALCRGGGPALLMGTDAPALTALILTEAADALLDGADAVFVPAEDGGYAVVGLRRPVAALFDGIPWGTSRVMDETRRRLCRARVSWRELARCWDVDRPEDVDRLLESGIMPEIEAVLRHSSPTTSAVTRARPRQ